jgi:hypothetical protein
MLKDNIPKTRALKLWRTIFQTRALKLRGKVLEIKRGIKPQTITKYSKG